MLHRDKHSKILSPFHQFHSLHRWQLFEHQLELIRVIKLEMDELVMFPSILIGIGESWTLMKTISVTEYLNYEAGKFSMSKGVGVFGNDAKDTRIPVEVWRYYLLTNILEVGFFCSLLD
ncbi:probable methionine--tRNA ligase [Tanacetum coccineum]